MKINQRLLVCALALCIVPGLYAAENDDAGNVPSAAPPETPATLARTEIELLRSQIALQQQQIEILRSSLEKQQRQIETLAGAEPQNPQIASLAPMAPGIGAIARSRVSLPIPGLLPASPLAFPAPQQAGQSSPQTQSISTLGVLPVAAMIAIPHSHEQEHAEVRQPKKWYEKYTFRGYMQLRHNRLVQTNDNLVCQQCDGATAINNNFIFRRARFVLSGEINDQISLYFQPDFAVTSGNLHFAQIRDLYADIALDKKKEFRFRVGQSKVPYSFENLSPVRTVYHLTATTRQTAPLPTNATWAYSSTGRLLISAHASTNSRLRV